MDGSLEAKVCELKMTWMQRNPGDSAVGERGGRRLTTPKEAPPSTKNLFWNCQSPRPALELWQIVREGWDGYSLSVCVCVCVSA